MIKLPVVEKFVSIQGEGYWAGTVMWFIRLGGCVVGESGSSEGRGRGMDVCTLPSGYKFRCDTAWGGKENIEIGELIDWCPPFAQVCITGGEPIAYDLPELVEGLQKRDILVHIETSGVGQWQEWMNDCWVTVSPKLNYNPEIIEKSSEIKWLVSENVGLYQSDLDMLIAQAESKWVTLQPIEDKDYKENLRFAIEMCKQHPQLKLSVQLHKIIGVR